MNNKSFPATITLNVKATRTCPDECDCGNPWFIVEANDDLVWYNPLQERIEAHHSVLKRTSLSRPNVPGVYKVNYNFQSDDDQVMVISLNHSPRTDEWTVMTLGNNGRYNWEEIFDENTYVDNIELIHTFE